MKEERENREWWLPTLRSIVKALTSLALRLVAYGQVSSNWRLRLGKSMSQEWRKKRLCLQLTTAGHH